MAQVGKNILSKTFLLLFITGAVWTLCTYLVVPITELRVPRPSGYYYFNKDENTDANVTYNNNNNNNKTLSSEHEPSPAPKVILLWNIRSFRLSDIIKSRWDRPLQNELCNYSSCIVTLNHSFQDVADILVFHAFYPMKWSTTQKLWQMYVAYNHESPSHVRINNSTAEE